VRGLNEPSQIQEVNKFLSNNKVQVYALLETRIRIHNVEKMKRKFFGLGYVIMGSLLRAVYGWGGSIMILQWGCLRNKAN